MKRVNVDQMMDEIDELQFRKWMAFDRICPFGDKAENEQIALMASMLVNMEIVKGEKIKPSAFRPYTEAGKVVVTKRQRELPTSKQTPEEQIAIVTMIAQMQNSTVR